VLAWTRITRKPVSLPICISMTASSIPEVLDPPCDESVALGILQSELRSTLAMGRRRGRCDVDAILSTRAAAGIWSRRVAGSYLRGRLESARRL
jgi:hypothetical protein